MRALQAFVLFALGAFLLAMDWRSLASGWLPFGSRGFLERLELRRDSRPVAYWLAFAFYAAIGVALIVLGLRILTGATAPLG